ncbi:MAG: DUF1475 family protein [Bdellovibrionota bacterium]
MNTKSFDNRNLFLTLFGGILVVMLVVTTWASLQESIIVGGEKLFQEPWGIATLADAYFGFLTFFVWVAYKEVTFVKRMVWLILILILGNIAMSVYVLLQIVRLPKGQPFDRILLRNQA